MTGTPEHTVATAARIAPTTAVAVRDLTVTFPPRRGSGNGLEVLAGIDLTVGTGEFVAILGPSGCGKSTLLRALGGLLDPSARASGTVEVPHDSAGKRATAWMPQDDGLLPWRRALGNALVGASAAGVPRAQAAERARALLGEFGLAGFERAWPHELSGGMRQRLALLRTCLADKPVLLLDEPFGALDPVTRRHMNTWLASMDLAHGQARRTVVLVTHDVDEAMVLADRIVVLSGRPGTVAGQWVADASVTDRFDRAELLAALGC